MDSEFQNEIPVSLRRCSDLDLTSFSGLEFCQNFQKSKNPEISTEDHEISITSSVNELIQFEALENAAENDDSFVSNISYANRFWNSRPSSLKPPSSFETIDHFSTRKCNENDVGCSDFPEEGSLKEKNLLLDLIDSGESVDHKTTSALLLNLIDNGASHDHNTAMLDLIDNGGSLDHKTAPAFDPETEDSDDDTQSLASISQFHASLPVVMSTPSAKIGKKKILEEKSLKEDVVVDVDDVDDVRNSLPASNLIRKLFPFADSVDHVVSAASPVTTSEGPAATEMKGAGLNFSTLREARMNSARTINTGDGVVIKELQDKLGELKNEIAKFRTENAKLTKGRLECDATMKQLVKDRERLNFESETRLQQIEEIHRSEMKKLEMEKKILYKHVNMQKQDESRRLTETNRDLMTEIKDVREELKKTEGRHQGILMRLRERIKSLENENDQLKDKMDALAEDKQELVRETIRLSKQNSGKAFCTEERRVNSPNSITDSSPRRNPPTPSVNKGISPRPISSEIEKESIFSPNSNFSPISNPISNSNSSPNSFFRPILKPPDKVSPPQKVRFDPESVSQISLNDESFSSEKIEANGTIEQVFKDGRKIRKYKNGTKKEISRDGKCSTTTYFNGDVRQVLPNKEVYYYAGNQTVHTVYPDGTEILQFANNQTEKFLPDGSKEVQYPNMMVRKVHINGDEQCTYPDGNTEHWNNVTKTRTINFANGETEIHTQLWKKRIFPDGTEKIVYSDGRSETRYSNGRIRTKDSTGKLVFDTEGLPLSTTGPPKI